MNDDEFLSALESCRLPAVEFGHAAHVRAAYLYLRRAAFEAALDDMRRSLQRYVAHLGKPDRYDEAMTAAYMRLIERRIGERGDAGGWTAFVRDNADLVAWRL
jgi:hypothetical protein